MEFIPEEAGRGAGVSMLSPAPAAVAALEDAVLISIVTRVELEVGVYREPAQAPSRRARLDAMLSAIPALAFDDLAAKTYGAIVANAGYSRRKLARPDDRSSSSGAPSNFGHLQPR